MLFIKRKFNKKETIVNARTLNDVEYIFGLWNRFSGYTNVNNHEPPKFFFWKRWSTVWCNQMGTDVVLDIFNKASRDEHDIIDQIYKSKYVRIIFLMILILYNIIRKCLLIAQ